MCLFFSHIAASRCGRTHVFPDHHNQKLRMDLQHFVVLQIITASLRKRNEILAANVSSGSTDLLRLCSVVNIKSKFCSVANYTDCVCSMLELFSSSEKIYFLLFYIVLNIN